MKELIKIGKFLSLILRHKPEKIGITLDKNGWASVPTILSNLNSITKEDLDWIVENNNKKRFEYNSDQTCIRACQGHSVEVDTELEKCIPPDFLYHGTSSDVAEIILKEGLKPMSRIHVHLSKDIETAISVGKRKGGELKILTINALTAHNEGVEFFVSKNGVYLSKYINSNYIHE